MKNIQIQAKPFFEMLKNSKKSMWEIFAHMVNGKEQEILFMEKDVVWFTFLLPATVEELDEVKDEFDKKFKIKLKTLLN